MNVLKIDNYMRLNSTPLLMIYLFFFAICLIVYFNALNNDFIFEDNFLIVNNLYIRDFRFIGKIFKTDIFHFHPKQPDGFSKYYRPLQALSYSIDYFFWKLNPFGYRLTNCIIHSLNGYLLFLIIYLIFKDEILASLSGAFFCVSPIQVVNVAYLSPRSCLLVTLFMSISLVTFIYYSMKQKNMHFVLSLSLFILALLAHEGALLLPFFIIICAIFLYIDKKRTIMYVIPYTLIVIFYIVFRAKFMPCDKFNLTDIFSLERISRSIWTVQEYFGQNILPIGFQASLFGKNIIFKFILFSVSFLIIAYSLIKAIVLKNRIVAFALVFYLVSLLPLIKLIDTLDYLGRILSEHYVYMASMGFCILISNLILSLHNHFPKISKLGIIAILLIFSSLSMISNTNYKDEATFYKYVLSIDRNNPFIHLNLGNLYYEEKKYTEAIKQAQLVLASEPDAWDAYLLLGNVFGAEGKLDKALQFYKKAIILHPGSNEAFNNIGLIYVAGGKDEEAYKNFKKALELNPESLPTLKNFSDFLIERRLYQEAIPLCERILGLDPMDIDVRVRIGIILAELTYFKEAETIFKEVLKLRPDSVEVMKNLGALYGNAGDFNKAISIWQEVLEIKPDDQEAKKNIERANKLKGN